MTAMVHAEALSKDYRGHRGVDHVSFTLEPGEVLGFLGPNGSGKTTTIRMMLGLIRPSGGSLAVLGANPWSAGVASRARLGYVPGDLALYERMRGHDLVRYAARLRGMQGTGDAVALATRLEVDLSRPVRVLSRGNRQKVGLVLAFMHRPSLLVLDEPTSGLDPLMQQVFHEMVREAADDGRSVFLSSHVLGEVQQVADRVAVIREGHLVLTDTVDSLRRAAYTRVEITFATPPPRGTFDRVPGVRVVDARNAHVMLALEGSIDPLLKALAPFEVLALDSHEADLEDIFLSLYREGGHAAP